MEIPTAHQGADRSARKYPAKLLCLRVKESPSSTTAAIYPAKTKKFTNPKLPVMALVPCAAFVCVARVDRRLQSESPRANSERLGYEDTSPTVCHLWTLKCPDVKAIAVFSDLHL